MVNIIYTKADKNIFENINIEHTVIKAPVKRKSEVKNSIIILFRFTRKLLRVKVAFRPNKNRLNFLKKLKLGVKRPVNLSTVCVQFLLI